MIYIENEYLNLKQIANSGQCFRWISLEDGTYIVISRDKAVQMKQMNTGVCIWNCKESQQKNSVALETSTTWGAEIDEADRDFWEEYLDLHTDYATIQQEIDIEDIYLKEAAKKGKGIRILKQDLWEIMVSFMISQNNNIPRIKKSINALCTSLGTPITISAYRNPEIQYCQSMYKIVSQDKETFICYTFPAAAVLADADLSGYSLGYRERYVQGLARQVADEIFDMDALIMMDAQDARMALKSVTGIGNKVADCIRLFGLHQLGVFPVDTWIQRIQEEYYKGHFPVEQYPNSAGVMQQYLFEYARQNE